MYWALEHEYRIRHSQEVSQISTFGPEEEKVNSEIRTFAVDTIGVIKPHQTLGVIRAKQKVDGAKTVHPTSCDYRSSPRSRVSFISLRQKPSNKSIRRGIKSFVILIHVL